MTIYRVQDKDGRGPWKPGFSRCWVEDRDDHDNLPPWPIELGHAMAKRRNGMHVGCGCLTLDQLRRWFTESEYKTLARLGYRTVQMDGHILAQSDIQCVFERSRALRKGVKPVALYPHGSDMGIPISLVLGGREIPQTSFWKDLAGEAERGGKSRHAFSFDRGGSSA